MPRRMIARPANRMTGGRKPKWRFWAVATTVMRQHQDAPPAPSILADAHGPIIAETTIAMEDAPKRTGARRNRQAIGTAKTAWI